MLQPRKSALLLGGTSEIGLEILAALAAQGYNRFSLGAREPETALASLTARLRATTPEPSMHSFRWDATEIASHQSVLAEVFVEHGPFDAVICAVGALGHHAGLTMAPTEVAAMIATNASGPCAALAAVADLLTNQRSGHPGRSLIVVISSVAAARARKSNFVYGASKSCLDAYAQGLRDACVGSGIEVLILRPGFVRTRMTAGLAPAPMATTPEVVAAAAAKAIVNHRGGVLWIPARLGPLMAILRNLPIGLWRRVAGDR